MKRRKIIIVDKDKNNQQVLKNHFLESNFDADVALNDTEAMKLVSNKRYDAMLTELSSPGIDGYGLLEMVQKSAINASMPVVLITTKSDVWNRVKSLQQGAKDYIIKPVHVKELITRINMLINRIDRKSEEERIFKKKFSGKLEDISIFDLIKVFGSEKKTGILSLFKDNGHTGQIFFENGNIINAGTILLNAELAVYKMMTWKKGFFSMHFCDIDIIDEINVSNLAILLRGAMRMEHSDELMKGLPPLDTIVTTTPNFKKITAKQELQSELLQFLELFDGQRTLEQVIDDSKSDELETMKRIQRLYEMGFLTFDDHTKSKPKKETNLHLELDSGSNALIDELLGKHQPEGHASVPQTPVKEYASASTFTPSRQQKTPVKSTAGQLEQKTETTVQEEQVVPKVELTPKQDEQPKNYFEKLYSKAKGTILIIGKDISVGKTIVDNLATAQPVMKNSNLDNISDIYVGTASFKHDIFLNLTSISTEKEFDPLLQYFSPKTLGYILLVDIQRANWNYYHYLLNVLRRRLSVPSVIVVSNKDSDSGSMSIDSIRARLSLKSNEKLMFCSEYNEANSKKIIFSLFKNYYKKT